jgi:hypothetical protein
MIRQHGLEEAVGFAHCQNEARAMFTLPDPCCYAPLTGDASADACTAMRFGWSCAVFGRCTSSTPSLYVAVTCSASMAVRRVNRLLNVPDARSGVPSECR